MKRKMKRFSEGDEVIDMRDNPSSSVDEDTRARAMKFLQTGKKDDEEESKPAAKKTSSVSKSEPTKKEATKTESKDYSDQNERRSKQSGYEAQANIKRLKEYDKPVEAVYPEEAIPGGGQLKGLLRMAGREVARKAAKDITPKPAQLEGPRKQLGYDKEVANRRSSEGYSPEEAIAARKASDDAVKESAKAKSEAAKKGIEAKSERTKSSGAMSGDFKTSEIRKGFKSGGMTRTSPSKRGDGIATKGFTRGKIC
jgi:hypothetical protein